MSKFHQLRVNSITRETAQAVIVGFEVPDDLKDKFDYVAGQYLTLEKEVDGVVLRRSYSICTAPESGKLKVAVKQIADGRFSSWVNTKLNVGDELNVFLPEGRFVYQPQAAHQGRTFVGFAAGSGITPVMAILQSVLNSEANSKFVLVYGNKTPEETIFYKDLNALKEKYKDRLFVEFVYSRVKKDTSGIGKLAKSLFKKKKPEPQPDNAHYGRIEADLVKWVVMEKYADENLADFYLCGPEEMIKKTSKVLNEQGIGEHQIHYELFVTKEPEAAVEAEKKNEGKTEVTFILDEEETTLTMDRSQRVLDVAREAELDPPYSCLGGICSSCMAQVVEGEVEMVNNQILTDGEVSDGLILTCQAHPTTDKLVVDYDDI